MKSNYLLILFLGFLLFGCSEKESYPIGDKAFFQVSGNVERIEFTQTASGGAEFTFFTFSNSVFEFDSLGRYFLNGEKLLDRWEGDNHIYEIDSEEEEVVDGYIQCVYNDKGRLKEIGFWEAGVDIQYDEKDRVSVLTLYGFMNIESKYEYTFTYGSGINPTGVSVVETHPGYDSDGGETAPSVQTYSYTYENVEVDSHGNWTHRKRSDGEVEKRVIRYAR